MSSGLLLALPLESVALRLALALGVALVLLRLVSTWDLRSPRARSVLAAAPFVVAAAVIVISFGDLGLPSLLVPSGLGAGSLSLPVADRYLEFAPMAPVIVAVWASVSLALIGLRFARAGALRRTLLAGAEPAGPRVATVVLRLARDMSIVPPRALLVERGIGGAAVLGVRDPIVAIDRAILDRLDDEELEGVLAHELAHIARRDNLLAWAVAAVRDIAFFVPGAAWAVRSLHREREAAADHDAVAVTGRPAALASGLLAVVEHTGGPRRVAHGCAALVPSSSVVDRVQLLLREETPSPREHRLELALAAAVSLVAVAAAIVLPSQMTGQGQRDALGVLLGGTVEISAGDVEVSGSEGRVFSVYRSLGQVEGDVRRTAARPGVRPVDVIGPEDRPGMALACASGSPACATQAASLGLLLRPAPIVLLEDASSVRWQATPVADAVAGERFAVYWLSRLESAYLGR